MKFPAGILSAALALATMAPTSTHAMPICNAWKGAVYDQAKAECPELANAIQTVQDQGSVPWYTDNTAQPDLDAMIGKLQAECGAETKIPMVIYGLPKKDCKAGYSDRGANQSFEDYQAFIDRLQQAFPTQNMVYIMEPDAIGLLADAACAAENEYSQRVKWAIEKLSENPNAEIYLDIGYWTLTNADSAAAIAKFANEVWPTGKCALRGIALNTSNYQSTDYMLELCNTFAQATGKNDLKCIIDTSRNNVGPTASNAWCNAHKGGVGVPPTMDTGNDRAAYYLWVKPPGESDGTCENEDRAESLVGPEAGQFFKEHFEMLWNDGYFVAQNESLRIGGGAVAEGATPVPEPETPVPQQDTPEVAADSSSLAVAADATNSSSHELTFESLAALLSKALHQVEDSAKKHGVKVKLPAHKRPTSHAQPWKGKRTRKRGKKHEKKEEDEYKKEDEEKKDEEKKEEEKEEEKEGEKKEEKEEKESDY